MSRPDRKLTSVAVALLMLVVGPAVVWGAEIVLPQNRHAFYVDEAIEIA